MSWHAPPFAPQIRHWYWKLIGAVPRHVPGLAVTVLPTAAWPLIVGRDALDGAATDLVVTADAAEAAPRAATSASTGSRRNRFIVEPPCVESVRGSPGDLQPKRRLTDALPMLTTC